MKLGFRNLGVQTPLMLMCLTLILVSCTPYGASEQPVSSDPTSSEAQLPTADFQELPAINSQNKSAYTLSGTCSKIETLTITINNQIQNTVDCHNGT